jgi:hypothetical protein
MARPPDHAWWLLVALALAACARERVEVADGEPEANTLPGPSFPIADASSDRDATCGPPPVIGSCARCDGGYLEQNGKATCICCE